MTEVKVHVLTRFNNTIENFGPFEGNPIFAIGVSGGIDSTALVLMMHQWVSELNGRVIALTVNHNLRPESSAEAKQVKALLNQHGIEHHILDWEHEQVSSNIHQKARLARLQLLTDWCREHHVLHLCLGHIKDDLAETFLMNSLRGSGVYGLASIARSTVYNKIAIYRPLLDFTKNELRQYLVERQVNWIEDPSNQNTKFFRTNVRNLLSSQDLAVNRLALSAKNLGRARHYMETECALASARIVNIFPEGYLTIKLQDFSALHEELALYLLSSCLITISGKSHYKPRLESLEGTYKAIIDLKPSTLWGCEIKTKGRLIYIYREGRGYTVEQVDTYTWIWDNRFKIVAQDPCVISIITTCSTSAYTSVRLKSSPALDRLFVSPPTAHPERSAAESKDDGVEKRDASQTQSLPDVSFKPFNKLRVNEVEGSKKMKSNCTNDYRSSFDSGASHLRSGRTDKIPKKIYYSLPAIILQDGSLKVPFVDNLEETGIKVTFEPNRPLAKIKFDY